MTPKNAAITVVLIAGNNRQRAQRMLRSVLDQDIADQIAIMVFDRANQPSRDLPELTRANIIYEAVDKQSTIGQLQARAALSVSTDIIAFVEEHVMVPPGWAREILQRHDEGQAGVSGMFECGNPHHRWARIVFSITYGRYAFSNGAGETNDIPGDNSSFVRSKLLRFRDDMELLLSTDILLVGKLVAEGEKLYRSRDLTFKHWNDIKFADGWKALFYSNRIYICDRCTFEQWSPPRRALRFALTPLVPFVRLLKNYRHAKRNEIDVRRFLADLPALFLFQLATAAGMASGLLFGYQNSRQRFADCETTAENWD